MKDSSEDLSLNEVLVEEVIGSLHKMSNVKSSGPDGFYPTAVEESKDEITELWCLNSHLKLRQ